MDAKCVEARRAYDGAVHPQTGELIPAPFRLSAFVPVCAVVASGMLLSPATPTWRVFWQVTNNGYDAAFNYCNRNSTNSLAAQEIGQNFVLATAASCTIALGLDALIRRSSPKSVPMLLTRLVPFAAVATTAAMNVVVVRQDELWQGVRVEAPDGNYIGQSPAAGQLAVGQTALSRIVMAGANLVAPPAIMAGIGASGPAVEVREGGREGGREGHTHSHTLSHTHTHFPSLPPSLSFSLSLSPSLSPPPSPRCASSHCAA
jgi:hypothetical protein